MASELETWWSQQYSVYSLRDLHSLPIFKKFVSLHYQYEREGEGHFESFRTEGDRDVFQWTDSEREEGEVFGHDRSIDTWFYERHYKEGVTYITVKTWRSPVKEWGEIIRQYREYAVHEIWKLEGESRGYERFELQEGEKRGIKTGAFSTVDGIKRWIEKYWMKGSESEFEHVWELPDSKGGEIKNTKDGKFYGEVWSNSEDRVERKCWHIEGEHEWGHITTETCGKRVNEKWELTKTDRSEERLTEDGDRRRGFRYVRKGADWYRQEWDGLQVVGVDESVDVLKQQKLAGEIDEIRVNEFDGLLKGETTLKMLLTEAPHFKDEVEDILKERERIPKPDVNDPESLMTTIRLERQLLDKQELLKQRMIGDIFADHGKYYLLHIFLEKLLRDSHSTLREISIALERNKEAAADVVKWGEIVEDITTRPGYHSYDKDVLYIDNLVELEKVKQGYIDRLRGGIERAEVEKAMELLYQIMVKHDAVSDKIVELVGDQELKDKLDSFQDMFEDIHAKYQENFDPQKLHENLRLLMDYQPIHLHLVGRLRGYAKQEVNHELDGIKEAVEETKEKMSLKNARKKVRSGRPTRDTPFQVLDRALARLIPFMIQVDKTSHGRLPPGLVSKLQTYQEKSVDSGDPFEITMEKAQLLQETADELEPKVVTLDVDLEMLDDQMDDIIKHLASDVFDDRPEEVAKNRALLARKYTDEDAKLFQEKLVCIKPMSDEVMELQEKIETLYLTIEELERIIEEKSEEITELTIVLDQRDLKVHQLNTELYDKQKYKPWYEAKDKECELLKLKIADLLERIKVLEEKNADLGKENSRLQALVEELEKFKLNALNLQEENRRLQTIITQYETTEQERKREYETTIQRLNDEIDKKQTQIDEKDAECQKHLAELNRLKMELGEHEKRVENLQKEADGLREKLSERKKEYEEALKQLNDELDKRQSALEELESELQKTITELNKTKLEVTEQEKRAEALQKEADGLRDKFNERKREYEESLKRLNEDIEKRQSLDDGKDAECQKHLADLNRAKMELAEHEKRVEALQKELDALREKLNELEAFKVSALDYKKENERLKGIIKSFEEMLGTRTSQYDEIIANLNAKVAELEQAGRTKDAVIEDLSAQLKAMIREKQRQLQLRTMMKLANTLRGERTSVFLTWKLRSELPPELISEKIMEETPEVLVTSERDEELWSESQLNSHRDAEYALMKIKRHLLQNNVIFKHLLTDRVKFDQPMPIVSFYVLLEEIMEKKVESDKSDINDGRRPAHFGDFVLEYLLKLHGVKKVAQRDLVRMIPMLYHQYNANVPLAIVIARLMHMFHPSPAPLEASVLLMRFSFEFKTLAERYYNARAERNLPPLSEAERLITGGETPLFDVLDTFYQPFSVEPVYIWHFLRCVKPTCLTVGEYVCSVIDWFAAAQGNREKAWETLCGDSETIVADTFVYGVTSRLGLKLSPKILREAHTELSHSGILTRNAFDARVRSLRSRPLEDFLVSRGLFLTGVLEAYFAQMRRNALVLKNQFVNTRMDSISQSVFTNLVKEIDSSLSEETVEKLHEGGKKWSTNEPVDVVGFAAELLVHPIDNLSKPPLHVEKFGALTDDHAFEFDLVTGSKILFTKITTTTVTRRTTRSGSARRMRLNP